MKQFALSAVSFAIIALASSAQAQTLDEAIQIAAQSNPLLAAADARVDAAAAQLQQARSALLPQVTASGKYSTAETNFGVGRQDLEPRSVALSAEQLVFSGGRAVAGWSQGRANLRAEKSNAAAARAALAADVADAYLGVFTAQRGVAFRIANHKALEKLALNSKLRFEAGEAPKSEVAQAEARRAGAEAELARARADLASAQSGFRRIVGVDPANLTPVDATPPVPETLDEALARAQISNDQLSAMRQKERAASAGVRRAAAEYFPRVSVAVETSSIRDEFLPGYRADGTAFIARATWPLFTGGRITGEFNEARAMHAEARALLTATERSVVDGVTRAFETYRATILAEAAAQRALEASEIALDSVRDEASVGQRPMIDLLDAERDLLQAQVGLDSAHADKITAAYRLNALLGGN